MTQTGTYIEILFKRNSQTGFDGFLVENMIFEIHLDDTGLLICVEFEINYSLNIPLPFFSRSTNYEQRLMLSDSGCSSYFLVIEN